jgi:hypothetical protein
MVMVLALASTAAAAQSDERAADAERRALEAERRAVAAERRELDAERRAFQAERSASAGSSQPAADPVACQAAIANYQVACAAPSRDPLWETPQCTIAAGEMRKQCYAGQ